MDQLTAMNVFRRVVELESFSAAARDLGLSNAAASKNISELEADLGVRLLTRTTRRLSLTEAGDAYYRRCTRILDELEEAREEVGQLSETPRGTLSISAPMSFGLLHLAPVMPQFLARYPLLKANLVLNDRFVDLVEEGFDLALRGGTALGDSSLIARKLAPIQRVVCAAPSYLRERGRPRSPRDLEQHECVIYGLSASPKQWSFSKGEHKLKVRVDGRFQTNSSIALKEALVAGAGLGLVPTFVVAPELRRKQLQAVLTRWHAEPQSLYAVYPQGRYVPRKIRCFLEFLSECFSGKPPWDTEWS